MKKITSMEFNSLIWFLVRGAFVGITLSSLIYISKQDAWISGILALILGIIPIIIFIKLSNFNKNFNIVDLNEYLFGKASKFINIVLALGAFIFIEMCFLNLIHFVHSQFLYETNPFTIAIVFIIPLIYGLYKGINAISRTSLIMFYLIILTIVFIIIGVSNGVDLNNLKPFFETKETSIFHGSLVIIAHNILPLFFLTIIPVNKIQNYNLKHSAIIYIIAILSLINAAVLTIGSFGVDLSLIYEYPEFNLLKKLEIGNFIGRTESLLSMEWIIALFLLILIGIYFITKTITQTFKTEEKTSNIIIFITCLLLLIITPFIFNSSGSADEFFRNSLYKIMLLFFFIIPLLILITAKLKYSSNQNSSNRYNNTN